MRLPPVTLGGPPLGRIRRINRRRKRAGNPVRLVALGKKVYEVGPDSMASKAGDRD